MDGRVRRGGAARGVRMRTEARGTTMTRTLALLAALCLAAAVCAAGAGAGDLDAFAGRKGRLTIAGGTAHIPVMNEAAKRIMRANKGIRITVAGGGSALGVQKVGEGLVDIGNTGRAPSPAETAKYGLVSFPFALDGVAVVVHPSNPVDALTTEQVRALFAGEAASWKDLGGPDLAVRLHTRDGSSATRQVFREKILGGEDIAAAARTVASNRAMRVAVACDPGAVGYLAIGFIDGSVKAPLLDGVAPTQENAWNGTYTVARRLFMNTRGEPSGLAADFIAYILGPEGAEIIFANGYIPLR